jgi:signal transduction histidine kinase
MHPSAIETGGYDVVLAPYAGLNSWRGVLALWASGGRLPRSRDREAREVAAAISRCLTALRKSELSREQAIASERSRWATDLHDGHLQTLSSAKLHAEVCAALERQHHEFCLALDSPSSTATRLESELERLHELLVETVREARQFLLELRSPPVTAEQFLPWLHAYADDFSRDTGIKASVRVQGDGEMPQSQVEEATRLIREALTNVRKHAKAGSVRIVVAFTEVATSISIVDDGVGFNVRSTMEELLDSSHSGLIGIRYHTESVGGEMRLRSEIGKGTTLLFRFPRGNRRAGDDRRRTRGGRQTPAQPVVRPSSPAIPTPGAIPSAAPHRETSVRESIRETLADAISSFIEQETRDRGTRQGESEP